MLSVEVDSVSKMCANGLVKRIPSEIQALASERVFAQVSRRQASSMSQLEGDLEALWETENSTCRIEIEQKICGHGRDFFDEYKSALAAYQLQNGNAEAIGAKAYAIIIQRTFICVENDIFKCFDNGWNRVRSSLV